MKILAAALLSIMTEQPISKDIKAKTDLYKNHLLDEGCLQEQKKSDKDTSNPTDKDKNYECTN